MRYELTDREWSIMVGLFDHEARHPAEVLPEAL